MVVDNLPQELKSSMDSGMKRPPPLSPTFARISVGRHHHRASSAGPSSSAKTPSLPKHSQFAVTSHVVSSLNSWSQSRMIFYKATQVKKTSSTARKVFRLMGVFRTRKRALRRPKKHSMSLRTDSTRVLHAV